MKEPGYMNEDKEREREIRNVIYNIAYVITRTKEATVCSNFL